LRSIFREAAHGQGSFKISVHLLLNVLAEGPGIGRKEETGFIQLEAQLLHFGVGNVHRRLTDDFSERPGRLIYFVSLIEKVMLQLVEGDILLALRNTRLDAAEVKSHPDSREGRHDRRHRPHVCFENVRNVRPGHLSAYPVTRWPSLPQTWPCPP